jgi:Family of unknown function (DUF6445)
MSASATATLRVPINGVCKFDDFAPNALEVRKAVTSGSFETHQGPDGATYTGISDYSVADWPKLIEKAIGAEIEPKLSCFRINYAGEMPHSWVHSDDICAKYASVLYLNPPEQCQGGTSFWRHEGLKIDRLPTREQIEASGFGADWFLEMMTREWKELKYWKQVGFVPMQFNRFITYPTSLFHSRFPFEGFGTTPADGRLIWICFYDIKGEA